MRKSHSRKPKAKLKYSYRPRLRSIVSAETRTGRKAPRWLNGIGRKVLLLAVLGGLGFVLHEKGVFTSAQNRVTGYFARFNAPKKETRVAVKTGKTAPVKPAKQTGMLARARKMWKSHFGPAEQVERPVAFIRLSTLQPIGRSGALLALPKGVFYDIPVVSGPFPENKTTGDTLRQAGPALRLLAQAEKTSPSLLNRISEVIVEETGVMRLLFTDSKLSACVSGDNQLKQLVNLTAYLSAWDNSKKGTINMAYGDIAFVTEEGENE